jgi:Holliday junction DNA resolvase RuvB-like protein
VKGRNLNGESPPIGDNAAGISGSKPPVRSTRAPRLRRAGHLLPHFCARKIANSITRYARTRSPNSLARSASRKCSGCRSRRHANVARLSITSCSPLRPGLGKTSLAHIIARELGANLRVTSGPAIERAGDLAAIVSDLDEGDVLLIVRAAPIPQAIFLRGRRQNQTGRRSGDDSNCQYRILRRSGPRTTKSR